LGVRKTHGMKDATTPRRREWDDHLESMDTCLAKSSEYILVATVRMTRLIPHVTGSDEAQTPTITMVDVNGTAQHNIFYHRIVRQSSHRCLSKCTNSWPRIEPKVT
jgi:hypothetical protein